jgi:hypothetical protein
MDDDDDFTIYDRNDSSEKSRLLPSPQSIFTPQRKTSSQQVTPGLSFEEDEGLVSKYTVTVHTELKQRSKNTTYYTYCTVLYLHTVFSIQHTVFNFFLISFI